LTKNPRWRDAPGGASIRALHRQITNRTLLVNPVIEQLSAHRSIRRYTARPIGDDLLHELVQAAQGAPSSSFIQAYSVVRVRDPAVRDEISKAAGDQRWIRESAAFLVMCADLKRVARAIEKTQSGEIEGYTEHFLASSVDVALFAQNLMTAAESVGLGAVFIGGIRNDPMVVSKLLQLPDLVYPVFGMCLGWPDQEPDLKPRMPVDMILHDDHYQAARVDADVDRYDEMMRSYYASRGENPRNTDWSHPTAAAIQGKTRPHMLEFLRARGFLKR
jgi:nitroreductase